MKKRKAKLHSGYITIILLFLPGIFIAQNVANMAYQLRMQGKADSAKVMLEDHLHKDSTDAAAWFELSRTKDHIRMGNPQIIMETEPITDALEKALYLEPDNALYHYTRAHQEIGNLYIGLMTEKTDEEIIKRLQKAEKHFLTAIEKEGEFNTGKITLVEMYSQLPPEKGGNIEKANEYANELIEFDQFMGSKAKGILLGSPEKELELWQNIENELPQNPDVLEALGKAHLQLQNEEKAFSYFEKAVKIDNSYTWLYLEKGRFFMMRAMQDYENRDKYIPGVESAFALYLEKTPKTKHPVKAWVYSNLAKVKMHSGMKEEAQNLMEKANELDPHHSKAFGTPNMDLPADEVKYHLTHRYYFRPF